MQRATPWFVGPAIHGARAAQLFLRSRAHSRERARCAHTGAQQIDAQRSRLMAHSLSRLECRLPLMANTLGLARFGAATDERLVSEGRRTQAWPPMLASPTKKNNNTTSAAIQKNGRQGTSTEPPLMPT